MAITEAKERVALALAIQAATAAAAYGLKHALQNRGKPGNRIGREENVDIPTASAADIVVLTFAREMVIPRAEGVALAAGKWLGKNAPDRVCKSFLEPFFEALNEQQSGAGRQAEPS